MASVQLAMIGRASLLAAILVAAIAHAQPAAPPRMPVIDPANALEGPALLSALRKGGLVLYARHAQQAGPQQEAPHCAAANLVPAGEAEARALGEALHRLAIPIGRVRSSPFCRAIETARLIGFGEPEIAAGLALAAPDTPELHAARARILAEAPPPGSNTLLVSHGHASAAETERMQLDLVEVIVYRADGRGGSKPIARIRLKEWEALR
jgi:phosphohistidine phosphatase SixA